MDIAQDHKSRKVSDYWKNLVEGETGMYKAEVLGGLIERYFPATCDSILDIGCGTSAIALALCDRLQARRLVFMDYDEAVIAEMRDRLADQTVEWKVADIFKVGDWSDRFGLVMLLDMVHEVYSFYGRPGRDVTLPIDHARGVEAVRTAIAQVARLVEVGGGIVITDNVLSPETGPVSVRLRNRAAADAVRRFFAEYPSRRMQPTWSDAMTFVLAAHDFCILLTQYNKIKAGDEKRWNVEKLEIHQYMTERELTETFESLGFALHAVIGTPAAAMAEWDADFEVLDGMHGIPEKRVTLLAIKQR